MRFKLPFSNPHFLPNLNNPYVAAILRGAWGSRTVRDVRLPGVGTLTLGHTRYVYHLPEESRRMIVPTSPSLQIPRYVASSLLLSCACCGGHLIPTLPICMGMN